MCEAVTYGNPFDPGCELVLGDHFVNYTTGILYQIATFSTGLDFVSG